MADEETAAARKGGRSAGLAAAPAVATVHPLEAGAGIAVAVVADIARRPAAVAVAHTPPVEDTPRIPPNAETDSGFRSQQSELQTPTSFFRLITLTAAIPRSVSRPLSHRHSERSESLP